MAFRLCPSVRQLLYRSPFHVNQIANYTRKGFFDNLMDKIRDEAKRDKEMKESWKKFKQESEKLEKSKEIQQVRDVYKKIENELPTDTVDKLRGTYETVRKKVVDETEELRKKEVFKKGMDGIGKAADMVKETAQHIGDSNIANLARKGVEVVDKELQTDRGKMYQSPAVLKSRNEVAGREHERIIEVNEDATGVVIHKDSKWHAAWQNFKDNNPMMQKFFDMKTRYDESDSLVIRSFRFVTDRVQNVIGGMTTDNEMRAVLDEIIKIDASFTLEGFLKYCRFEVIPNVLEAMIRGDLKILEDWCHEAPFNVLASPLREAARLGYRHDSRVLDVHQLDLEKGAMMEQGPVLVIRFQTQQIMCLRDAAGEVKEGDPDKVLRVIHHWALCRDQNEMNPWAAWRVLDLAMAPMDQWL